MWTRLVRLPSLSPLVRPVACFEALEGRRLLSGGGRPFGHSPAATLDAPAISVAPRQAMPAYDTAVVASGLNRPTGIVVGKKDQLYFTQVPTPGVGGGANSVEFLSLKNNGGQTTLHIGEPEPTNITIDKQGTIYWTCKSAGVILAQAPDGTTSVLLAGLDEPSGIAVDQKGRFLYFTEVPTPGVNGANGGTNTVNRLNLATGERVVLDQGDPEPVDVAARNGDIYWTCKSAGVIVERTAEGVTSVLLRGLNSPTGIDVDDKGQNLYFTEVPTPGVSGTNGGSNTVNRLVLGTMQRIVVDAGDPEPTDVTVDRKGNLYWTCTSANVIVKATLVK